MDPGTSGRARRPSSLTLTAIFHTGPISSFPPRRVTGLRWPWLLSCADRACQRQPERNHLLAVANQQDVACQRRVVPGLAFDRLEPRELGEPVGCRPDQRQLTFFR